MVILIQHSWESLIGSVLWDLIERLRGVGAYGRNTSCLAVGAGAGEALARGLAAPAAAGCAPPPAARLRARRRTLAFQL